MKKIASALIHITLLTKSILMAENTIAPIADYLASENNKVTEAGMLPKRNPAAEAFVMSLPENYATVVANLGDYADDNRSQALLAVGAEFLSPQDYLSFVGSVCDRAADANGGVKDQFIRSILLARMIKGGFLAYHYEDQSVAEVITKLKDIAIQRMPGEWENYFASIESGEVKANVIQERQSYGDQLPEGLNDPGVLADK